MHWCGGRRGFAGILWFLFFLAGYRINESVHNAARDLSDEQWKVLDPSIPNPKRRKDGRGRPWKGRRSVLNGILWVLRTGAPWADLPIDTHHFRPVTVASSNHALKGRARNVRLLNQG